jgi:hypothetical protein
MDLEVREVILVEELKWGMHPTDGWDLSRELDKAHAHVDRINVERATEAERLLQRVMRIFNVLVDLGMLPIQDIPQLPESVQKVLPMADLVLKRLQEALASGAGPLD